MVKQNFTILSFFRKIMLKIVILAAGKSTRFGSPKQLSTDCGLEKLIYKLSVFSIPIIVVLGAHYEEILEQIAFPENCIPVYNSRYQLGMSTSLQQVYKIDIGENFLFTACDMPHISIDHYRQLIEGFYLQPESLQATKFPSGFGIPVIIPKVYKNEIMQLKGDVGGKIILQKHFSKVQFVDCIEYERENYNYKII